MRIGAQAWLLVVCAVSGLFPGRALANDIPSPQAMVQYCRHMAKAIIYSPYHQPDGQWADRQVLALPAGAYGTKQGAKIFISPSKTFFIQFPADVMMIESTRGPDYISLWSHEHGFGLLGCTLGQLSEAIRRNRLELSHILPEGDDNWLSNVEKDKEDKAKGGYGSDLGRTDELGLPDIGLDTNNVEVFARLPGPEIMNEFCSTLPPMRSFRDKGRMQPGTYRLEPAGRLKVFNDQHYLVFLDKDENRAVGTYTRDIFFHATVDHKPAVGGCSFKQMMQLLSLNNLRVAGPVFTLDSGPNSSPGSNPGSSPGSQ